MAKIRDIKTTGIDEFDYIAVNNNDLSDLERLSINSLGTQIGEANKIIDSDTIVVEEEIKKGLGTVRKLKALGGGGGSVTRVKKQWTVADGNNLLLTKKEIQSGKVLIAMDDLMSIAGDFTLHIPSSLGDDWECKFEVDYSACTFTTARLFRIQEDDSSSYYYDSFVMRML